MTKPELPPLPVTWTVPLAPPHEKAMWVSDAETWGLACYRAGLLRAAELFDSMGNNVQPHPSYCVELIHAEADKVG